MDFLNMSYQLIVAYLIQLGIYIGALAVIFFNNIVYAAISLALVLSLIALLYLFFDADFLAVTQILIYVGAINVLILFAIMLISLPKSSTFIFYFTKKSQISAFACISLFVLLVKIILQTPWSTQSSYILLNENNKLDQIGIYLLSNFLLPFELISLLLLIALIGAVSIARYQNTEETE
uniref:NAD(P)H-quinone oxidoreductase subunit 6, chloroplastic n=1 Tax=Chara vulgaris TaxID=55564 RepID=NU6C_CHAVU|nr:NADH dehydrogenase subunit 6 [Chara vulgaris]Q1ACE6.1 RecName: Full=NAD(P)H-quinone oxidoreductase subunit 6, chloroplastic; AltName: Full=NAD(P)H dehydrogenase subunit 6; AltName: Full=NADH-plastoquinone oxidoreductase subunit 6 [Chara vulgaris]ABA61923.1 subunit 6 of NADH-plastoquinone oxidoreductase [Chara vulgaris]WAP91366.1 NADH dehydrogenase subunit 6 [Chara vulgaris]